jgi:hypothetical protein
VRTARITDGRKVRPSTVATLLRARGVEPACAEVSASVSAALDAAARGELGKASLEHELKLARLRLAEAAELGAALGSLMLGPTHSYLREIRLLVLALHKMGGGAQASGAFEVRLTVVGADGRTTTIEPGGHVTHEEPPGAASAGASGQDGRPRRRASLRAAGASTAAT